MGGDAWLAAADPSVVESLESTGVAFPGPRLLAGCAGLASGVALFEVPAEPIFSLLLHTERHAEIVGLLAATELVSRHPARHVDRHEIRILFRRIEYYVEHEWSSERLRIWWHLAVDERSDLRALDGFWEFYPLAQGGTLGLYASAVDVGPIVPRRVQEALTRKNLRDALRAFHGWIEAEAR